MAAHRGRRDHPQLRRTRPRECDCGGAGRVPGRPSARKATCARASLEVAMYRIPSCRREGARLTGAGFIRPSERGRGDRRCEAGQQEERQEYLRTRAHRNANAHGAPAWGSHRRATRRGAPAPPGRDGVAVRRDHGRLVGSHHTIITIPCCVRRVLCFGARPPPCPVARIGGQATRGCGHVARVGVARDRRLH